MKRIFLLMFAALCPLLATAQITGTWEGTLNAGGTKLRVVFRIAEADGNYTATMDSPDQGLKGFPVAATEFRGAELTLGMPQFKAGYKGVLNAGIIVGVFSQNGFDMPLVLTLKTTEEVMRRPQEPQPPYPYRSLEIEIPNPQAGIVLKGTLTLPEALGSYPAVILLTGSGCQNRDEELMGHKPFLVLADYLTRRGIAVLRYDDRGWNETPEQRRALAGSTMADFAEDALAVFGVLKSQPGIDPARIGMLGHSEGATVALIAAARNPEVAFVGALAGMGVKGRDVLVAQNRSLVESQGLSAGTVAEFCRVIGRLLEAVEIMPPAEFAANRNRIVAELITSETNLPEPLRENLVQGLAQIEQAGNYMRFFLAYDPVADLAALGSRPLLAINGTKDCQVDAAMNLGRFRALRPTAGYPDDEIRAFEGLNHLFQPCATGHIAEYAQIETTIAPEVLEALATWLGKR